MTERDGRYRLTASGDDEPPTRPGTPVAKLTPAAGTVLDGPVTLATLRAELRRSRENLARDLDERDAALLRAVRAALEDGRTTSDRALYDRVAALEKSYRQEQPTLVDYADGGPR